MLFFIVAIYGQIKWIHVVRFRNLLSSLCFCIFITASNPLLKLLAVSCCNCCVFLKNLVHSAFCCDSFLTQHWCPKTPQMITASSILHPTLTFDIQTFRGLKAGTETHCRWRSRRLCRWGGPGSGPRSWSIHRCLQTATEPGWGEALPLWHCAYLQEEQTVCGASVELGLHPNCRLGCRRLTQQAHLCLR